MRERLTARGDPLTESMPGFVRRMLEERSEPPDPEMQGEVGKGPWSLVPHGAWGAGARRVVHRPGGPLSTPPLEFSGDSDPLITVGLPGSQPPPLGPSRGPLMDMTQMWWGGAGFAEQDTHFTFVAVRGVRELRTETDHANKRRALCS